MRRGEVRWCVFGRPDKRRPVVVLTRNPAIRFLNAIIVAPVTRTRRGSPSEVPLGPDDGMKWDCAANLDIIAAVRKDEIGALLCTLSDEKLETICRALAFAVDCEASR